MKVNVVIPCRDEVNYIDQCIQAIFASEIDSNTELVVHVVDGMSEDGTRQKIKNLCSVYANLRMVDNTKKMTPYAFNLGIDACKDADYVQIVGARHILSKNYIQTCIDKLLSNSDIWCVGGKLLNKHLNKKGEIVSVAMGSVFGMGFGNFRTLQNSCFTDTVTSPMYPSCVFDKIGYFDAELIRNQDDDFNFRVLKAGGKIWFESSIDLLYYVRGNYGLLSRQFYQYGYWKVFVNRKHKINTTLRQLVPPMFVANIFLAFFAVFFGVEIFAIVAAPMAVYVLLVFLISIFKTKKAIDNFQLMYVFPVMHLSYGFGYWHGILDFIVFNKKPASKNKRMSR